MAVALGVTDLGVAGTGGLMVAVALPQAARPARAINRPERVRTNRRMDARLLPGMRFINAIIQQVNGADEIGERMIGMLYFS
jgi:hypothetical protein